MYTHKYIHTYMIFFSQIMVFRRQGNLSGTGKARDRLE